MTKTPLFALLLLGACSDDPVSLSEPVGIELKAKSGDVTANAINESKGITTESGNPYGAFIGDAKTKIGKDPSRVELDKITLTLNGAQSTNVASLDEILTGDVHVQFIMNDTNDTFDAGSWSSPTGVGPDEGNVTFDWDGVSTLNVPKMIGGSFKVALVGPAATNFSSKGADASMQVTFTFSAYE